MSLLRQPAGPTDSSAREGRFLRRRSRQRLLAITLAVVTATAASGVVASASASPSVQSAAPLPAAAPVLAPDFGPNVTVFDPSMPVSQIQAATDAIYAKQVDNEMGTARYSLLFKPGSYGTGAEPLILKVGYYTEIAGLGADPTDVNINGHIDVYNRCLLPVPSTAPGNTYCVALNNFWRSLSNLTINVTNAAGMTDCRKTGNFWAASQASPMRRVNVNGNLTLMDYCTDGPQWSSGGFMADSKAGNVVNGSQQQYLVRNSTVGTWSNGVWNQVFLGTEGAPATNFGDTIPDPATGGTMLGTYTTLPTNPLSREKPYLYVDSAGAYNVLVPSARFNSSGISWANGTTAGRSIPLSEFYLARPSDSVATINTQLAAGKNLILTPGVYNVGQSIAVNRADTVVLGLGLPSLTSVNGSVPLKIADVKGVSIAGLMVDAGTVNSPALVTIGEEGQNCGCTDPGDPTTLSDVFFRIGGSHVGNTTLGMVIHSDNVLMDNIWSWRADHGNDGTFGWNVSASDTGLVVKGDNVTATGLFVEHYKKYNVLWEGEKGRTIFFQNEMPYDPPSQNGWRTGSALGYAGYKVAGSVKTHELWGAGSYIFTNVDPTIHAARAFEVPVTPGVQMHHMITVSLLAGIIDHVVNDVGAATIDTVATPVMVKHYPSGAGTTPPTASTPPTRPTTPAPTTTRPTTTAPTTTRPTTTAPTTRPTTTAPTTTRPTTTAPTTSRPTTTAPTTTRPTTTAPTTPPSGLPTNLRGSTTSNSATLTWTGSATVSYDILRGENGVKIATVTGNTFTDSGLNPNTPYVYSVRGPGGTTPQLTLIPGRAGTSTATSTTATTVNSPPVTTSAPVGSAPSNLRKLGQTSDSITLTWNGSATASYDILRGENGVKIATVTGNTFADRGLLANTPYVYSVRGGGTTTPQITVKIN